MLKFLKDQDNLQEIELENSKLVQQLPSKLIEANKVYSLSRFRKYRFF